MANPNANAASIGQNSMSRFFTDTGVIRQPSDRDLIELPPSQKSVNLFLTTDRLERNRLSTSCLSLCNVNNGSSNHQVAAYYLSALMGLLPNLRNVVRDMYRSLGIRANFCVGIAACEANGLEILNEIDSQKLLVYLAQAILILYKNVNVQGYDAYMRARHRALCSFAGFVSERDDDLKEVIIDIETATVVRTILLSHHELLVYVLDAILDNQSQSTVIGNVMAYLAGILEWTEMASVVFIFDTLLLPRSPVIFDRDVAMEVVYLSEAYKAINSVDRPPYFRIMFPHYATRIMERSRFPLLLSVAEHLRAMKYNTVNRFVTTTTSENPVVKRLIDLHEAGMANVTEPILVSRLNYLMNDEEDFDPTHIPPSIQAAMDKFQNITRAQGGVGNGGNQNRKAT